MFTGLVEKIGSESTLLFLHSSWLILFSAVTSLEPLDTSSSGGGGTSLTISDCDEILNDAHLGDSVAVNGKTCNTGSPGEGHIKQKELKPTRKRNMPHGHSPRHNLVQSRRRA